MPGQMGIGGPLPAKPSVSLQRFLHAGMLVGLWLEWAVPVRLPWNRGMT